MTIGEQIKEARKEKGLTQKQLGELCVPQIHEVQIRKYERGEVTPKMDTIKRIADGLGVSPSDLIGPEWFDHQAGPERLKELREDVSQIQAFEQYLKTLGYSVSYEGPADSEEPNVVLIKGKEKTTFTGGQFDAFKKAIADSVEYQIWQQRNKK